jgi:hypothetical protein
LTAYGFEGQDGVMIAPVDDAERSDAEERRE